MTVTLRPARPEDLGPVEALLTSAGLPLQGVARHLPAFLVAEHEGAIVGAAGLEVYATGALLRSVVIAPARKGQGLGAKLIHRLVQKAEAEGIGTVFLLTTTAEDYFPRFGFTRIERANLPPEFQASEELRGACPASAVVMRRTAPPVG
ncbi:GNAT family N-acetyltransferase [Myxococcus sp. CA056]|uniref:arsenic resistance N-acetyltransferase ArsN2 n=1 Tax=unclassified Myxococcus TaxID=2648731 RepID=UPI00157B8713|nr:MULTISPECIES: arsenic resistance N-acetyltransferase ArsN2 [unclassified Myxococcus]NTX10539.1 GNAT family N-acetyltransferase [Myxococcus sp. CA056]NTX38174.1 GNAT family N-acetyltransferase [Myxococcus sp. CA033]NTX53305.1 GNAT family N-acetyltransferase [Myxococcus sp. CA039A]